MGWLRCSPAPRKSLHNVAVNIQVEHKAAEDLAEDAQARAAERNDRAYPFVSKKVPNHSLPFITPEEIQKRDGKDGKRLFLVVDNIVLDCTMYLHEHPGGQKIMQGFGGQDCSWQWWTFHNRKIWDHVAESLRVGRTEGLENRHTKPKAFVGLRGLGYQEDFDS